MKGWLEKNKGLFGKKDEEELITTVNTKYEVNLVPEIKLQMIKAQKIRNLVLFVCIVVSAAAIGSVLVLFGIKSGQDIAMANQDGRLKVLSEKMTGYSELGDLVAIQGQLTALSDIAENKKILSRVFGALDVMLPDGEDVVQLSELRVNLEEGTLNMEGRADARIDPLIDYRVLESFKKGAALTKYDYGRYVDVNGEEIPSWCIDESDPDGNALKEGESYYAWWDLRRDGCGAMKQGASSDEVLGASDANMKTGLQYSADADVETQERELTQEEIDAQRGNGMNADEAKQNTENAENSENNGEPVKVTEVMRVKVWRTPQYEKWYQAGNMTMDGAISGIDHFESACIKYSGSKVGEVTRWTSDNECMLVPEGLTVTSSSNARDESNNLVLKFTATVGIEPAFFQFQNKHMIAIGPMGQNVTDSYVQIEGMFAQEVTECAANDSDCLYNVKNSGGN